MFDSLAAEAEKAVGEAARLRTWLDRFSGVSVLDYVPFGVLADPDPAPDPAPLPPVGGVLVT